MSRNRVLYLDGNPSDEYYNKLRNSYTGVTASSIFSKNTTSQKLLRRAFLKFNIPFYNSLFGSWANRLNEFDLIIIAANIYSQKIEKFIRKQSQIKIVHWYWNPVHVSINPELLKEKNSEIWSFDLDDCRKYSLNYSQTYYFENIQLPDKEKKYDVFFVGADKGRISNLIDIEDMLIKQGLIVKFHITKSTKSKKNDYDYKNRISYEEVLQYLSKSRVILDIVQSNQIGLSQRPMEALFFKKKLISNDVNLINYDFYNKNNIFILGKDNINQLREFVFSPYEEVDYKIMQSYTFVAWINRLSNSDNGVMS